MTGRGWWFRGLLIASSRIVVCPTTNFPSPSPKQHTRTIEKGEGDLHCLLMKRHGHPMGHNAHGQPTSDPRAIHRQPMADPATQPLDDPRSTPWLTHECLTYTLQATFGHTKRDHGHPTGAQRATHRRPKDVTGDQRTTYGRPTGGPRIPHGRPTRHATDTHGRLTHTTWAPHVHPTADPWAPMGCPRGVRGAPVARLCGAPVAHLYVVRGS